jgi:cytochrome c biogenesis protein CcmG/thiol:disulfide interchange protein DsbE
MPALEPRTPAPDFELDLLNGGRFSLAAVRQQRPVALAFLKVSCPVCQFAFPFLERIHQRFAAGKLAIVGVSQNNADDTRRFVQQFGVTFPVVLDPRGYRVSNSYGLTNVPTVFVIEPDGEIRQTTIGWVKKDYQELARYAAELGQVAAPQLFAGQADIPEKRPG